MKYLLCLTSLAIGTLAQNDIRDIYIDEQQHLPTDKSYNEQTQFIPSVNPMFSQPEITPEWIQIDRGNYEQKQESQKVIPNEPKQKHHGKHHRRQNNEDQISDQNLLVDPIDGWENGPRDHFGGPMRDQQNRKHRSQKGGHEQNEGSNCKYLKKHWKSKGIGHIIFFVILAALSFCLVRKCIKKRKDRCRQRQSQVQAQAQNQIMNPSVIDAHINNHYAEIQRLTQMKNSFRQVDIEPIIYHQVYPQEIQMTNQSQGRMINENCYPRNQQQNIQYQNIPVGRPVMINNPYSQPHIYRAANQY